MIQSRKTFISTLFSVSKMLSTSIILKSSSTYIKILRTFVKNGFRIYYLLKNL